MAKPCTLGKLFSAYEKAEYELIKRRNEEFPPGTMVKSRIHPDMIVEVKDGSLYPDQVNTDWGHMNWRYLEKVSDQPPSPGNGKEKRDA